MSYGYYRLGSSADPAKAHSKMSSLMSRLFHTGGVVAADEPTLQPGEVAAVLAPPAMPTDREGRPLDAPKVGDTLLAARAQGYTGDVCNHCGGARMKMAGHCMVCDDCGETTGCS